MSTDARCISNGSDPGPADPRTDVTIAVYVASVVFALACIALFIVAMRRMFGRHEEVVSTMLDRYDDRLADFAQTLNDAITPLPERILAAIREPQAPERAPLEHGNVMRLLEVAREHTSADAAVAIVSDSNREPILATVGLSDDEAAQVGKLGVPDYRGARAIQVSFNGEADGPSGASPIRYGLAVPLLDSQDDPGMLAVLTRSPDRRFGDPDINSLEDVVAGSRPVLEDTLALREPDPVAKTDPLTQLFDRQAFHGLLDREIVRARRAEEPLALLMLDVDRLTTINAQIGYLAADSVLAEIAQRLRSVSGKRDLPCRIGGGRFGVLVPLSDSRSAERLFERLQAILRDRPIPDVGLVSVSGGVAELLPDDDAAALLGRADAALMLAKGAGRDTVVTAGKRS
jgi:diguanylate cyclase (GGDEF)-like protein